MSNENQESRAIKLYTGAVEPGATFRFTVEPTQGLGEHDGAIPILLKLCSTSAVNFKLVSVTRVSGGSTLLVQSPEEGQAQFKLLAGLFQKGESIMVKVVNQSIDVCNFQGWLYVRPQTDQPPAGILSRCWSWFRAGLEAAIVHATLGHEDQPTLSTDHASTDHLVVQSPATVRDTIRRLCSDFADVAEIPLLAANLYWRELTKTAGGTTDERMGDVVTLGLPSVTVPSKGKMKMTVSSPYWLQPWKLKMGSGSYLLQVLSVGIGKDELLPSVCPVDCSAASDGIYLGRMVGAAGPGRDIVVTVFNPSDNPINATGAIDCEIFLHDPDWQSRVPLS